MTRPFVCAASYSRRQPRVFQWWCKSHGSLRRSYSEKSQSDDPLRILFCGTDSFSKEALLKLHDYSQQTGSNILSIDVVAKTDKRFGRGRKTIRSPAIKAAAETLGLAVHQIDTFTRWQPPSFGESNNERCNLIIAVSFGLLIPPRILGTAKYGGLNVHPSMLPDLRGPAPIEWAIMLGRQTTGVSLQTLHPSRFDEGVILDQTPQPGLEMPNADETTYKDLDTYLAPVGAKMLVDAIRNKVYMQPYNPVRLQQTNTQGSLVHAPKLTTTFRAVDFEALTSAEILRRNRACGPLHAFAACTHLSKHTGNIKFHNSMRAPQEGDIPEETQAAAEAIPQGVPYAVIWSHRNIYESVEPLIVNAKADDEGRSRQVVIPRITAGGLAPGAGAGAAGRAKLFSEPEHVGPYKIYRFSHPLTTQPALLDKNGAPTTPPSK